MIIFLPYMSDGLPILQMMYFVFMHDIIYINNYAMMWEIPLVFITDVITIGYEKERGYGNEVKKQHMFIK
ncbi:MAG: hypothetical protein E3J72_22425 [Planctomycetota bacterium]|nr:MAG: hypothetical protein E3J72_22425 [Planctomycetota bacterium]